MLSSSPCFSEAVSYEEQHRLSMKAIFHEQDVFVLWLPTSLPTGQAKVFATKLCLSPWILSIIVWLLDTIVVSSKYLTSVLGRVRILNAVDKRHQKTQPSGIRHFTFLPNNWFEIKRMRTTVCTRRSSSPPLQIGTPGNEATFYTEPSKLCVICAC